jgi:hypothetical protein
MLILWCAWVQVESVLVYFHRPLICTFHESLFSSAYRHHRILMADVRKVLAQSIKPSRCSTRI